MQVIWLKSRHSHQIFISAECLFEFPEPVLQCNRLRQFRVVWFRGCFPWEIARSDSGRIPTEKNEDKTLSGHKKSTFT